MEIPYKEIINNCVMKSELITKKKEFKIVKYFRRLTVNRIIDMLDRLKFEDAEIYKRDIINYYNFLLDLQRILGENLPGLTEQKDAVNYSFTITGWRDDNYLYEDSHYKLVVETIDTVSEPNAYYQVLYEEDDRVAEKFETLSLHSNSYIGKILYRSMINTIIKYIKYCN